MPEKNRVSLDLSGVEVKIDGETYTIELGEITLEENTQDMDRNKIWTEKYDHEGESFTRDKDIMAHLEKHRDINWSRQMMDTHEAPAAQREVDKLIKTIESMLSDEAREWWNCDECGHGGGGVCPRCKHDSNFHR